MVSQTVGRDLRVSQPTIMGGRVAEIFFNVVLSTTFRQVSKLVRLQLVKHFANIFLNVQRHFIAHCRCRQAVGIKLFTSLLSLHSFIETCNHAHHCTFL